MVIKDVLNLTKESSVGTYNPSAVNNPLFRFKYIIEYKRKNPKEIAKLLKNNSGLTLYVVGHTDNVGEFKNNMLLSEQRAKAFLNELVSKYTVNENQLKAYGNGPLAPVASNKDEAGRAKNRRVELVEQ